MKLSGLFRRESIAGEDQARIREAEEMLRRFGDAIDRALERSHRSGAPVDDRLAMRVSHRINWHVRCEANLKAARVALKRGDRAAFEELVLRAVAKAEEGIRDLER